MARERQGDAPYAAETHAIIGCAMEVLNTLGHGLPERPYENALVVEFEAQGILYQQQPRFAVAYKGQRVGEFIPDLIAYDRIVVDTKVIDRLTIHETSQMLNYLRVTGLKVGVLLNFSRARLNWKHVSL
ncbi:MAG: GxxExxY protein [Halofilum sp. (in: g-proteobacteria)]